MTTTHVTHWGAFEAESDGRRLTAVRPYRHDPEPNRLLENIASAQHHPTRIDRPYVRRGWLRDGPGPTTERGSDPFVPVSWDVALDLLADELRRVYAEHGSGGVFGGSYGWGSAGRFHHAQSQVHRFLASAGGYVRSVGNYSFGASQVLLPHVVGSPAEVIDRATSWESVAAHGGLVVAFGGMPVRNAVVSSGGVSRHELGGWVGRSAAAGVRFVLVSPLRDDLPPQAAAEWLAPRPGSDAALMLAVAHVLAVEGLADEDFLARYCVGYDRFERYLLGAEDGVPKTPAWAEPLTGVPATRITELAREMAGTRTLITTSWSMQRSEFGEQPLWLAIVLAAMLGQIGLPGGGFGHGYGSAAYVGRPGTLLSPPSLPQGENPERAFIPVARIADMLLHPGEGFAFDGQELTYPDVRLVYWAGGNPFHAHQDLARLHRAFGRPETVVVHDSFWTATARRADVVLPATMSIERDDLGGNRNDPTMFAMRALTAPHGQARDDYAVFADLAGRLGFAEQHTEGRDAGQWVRHLYEGWRAGAGAELPDFDRFWADGAVELPRRAPEQVLLDAFRADPDAHPLPTPSGRIEIFSAVVDGFGYDDCPGHPVWREPAEWLGSPLAARYPLQLIANQPRTRLHSQLDVGEHSRSAKVNGREVLRIHPADAAARGLEDGETALVRSERGSCLAAVRLSDDVRPGVVQLPTGAWYDPEPGRPEHCRHGNPNVLTADRPTSSLSQACAGQRALVEVERFAGELPELTVDRPPPVVAG